MSGEPSGQVVARRDRRHDVEAEVGEPAWPSIARSRVGELADLFELSLTTHITTTTGVPVLIASRHDPVQREEDQEDEQQHDDQQGDDEAGSMPHRR